MGEIQQGENRRTEQKHAESSRAESKDDKNLQPALEDQGENHRSWGKQVISQINILILFIITMATIGQGGAILCTLLLITLTYYIFLQQDLVTTEEVANSICLDKPGISHHLCVSCIRRSQFNIAN
jgi:hypothetical protein